MRGQTPQLENKLDRYLTMGVFPFPPHVKLRTLVTGTGNLYWKAVYAVTLFTSLGSYLLLSTYHLSINSHVYILNIHSL